MPVIAQGFHARSLAQWLQNLQGLIRAAVPDAEVEDQRFILARLLLIIAEELQRADNGTALAAVAMLDPKQAEGYWLRLIAWRINVAQIEGRRSEGLGLVTAAPGTVFSGIEQAEDKTTGLRWYVGPGTVGVTGDATLPIRALVDGPSLASTSAASWKIKTDLPDWTAFRAASITSLGRLVETENALRVRVLQALASSPATEYGDESGFARLGSDPSKTSLLGFKVNRQDVPDENGIPPHFLEVVLSADVAPGQVWAAMRATPSSTAGTWGNREVTQPGPFGPLTYKYSQEEILRLFASVVANTIGAPGAVPADLALQLAAGLSAWGESLGAGRKPTATDAEAYLQALLPKPLPVVDLEVTFSLDNVTFTSTVPVSIRQRPRISNEPSAAEIVGVVPGPYVLANGDAYSLGFDGAGPTAVVFTGAETTVGNVVDLFNGYNLGGLFMPTSDQVTATLIIRSETTGSTSSIEVGGSDPGPPVILGLPAEGTLVVGLDSDITVQILT